MNRKRGCWHFFHCRMSIILIVCFMVACASAPPAQVVDRQQPPSRKIVTHRVSPEETLYSIAWRYNLDYRQLARHNGIGDGFRIYTDQVLRLDVNNPAARVTPPPPVAIAAPAETASSRPAAKTPPVSAARPAPVQPTPSASRQENRTPASAQAPSAALPTGPVRWRWPVSGAVISGFGGQTGLNKGIDISGKLGQPVVAASEGQVVYAGTGLRGYGNLVIIKHSDTYLSAYAHNHALKVKEGQTVKAGQQIAELGSSGTDREKLHFEIRRDGKPVDPLQYLPKR